MVPRAKISAIDSSTPLTRALEIVANDGHSRYPVFRESLDQIVGLLYAKDLFRAVRDDKSATAGKLLDLVRNPVFFVSENQPLASILRDMKQKRQHLAIVSDEFGGTAGVITLEDILEELVGDIRDEYDTEGLLDPIGENRFVADASISIADLAAQLKRDIPIDGDFESLGGLIVHRAGGVPPPGTVITIDGLNLTVREADEKRVVKVEVSTKRAPSVSQPDASGPSSKIEAT